MLDRCIESSMDKLGGLAFSSGRGVVPMPMRVIVMVTG